MIRITSKAFKKRRFKSKTKKRYIGKIYHWVNVDEGYKYINKHLESLDLTNMLRDTRKKNSNLIMATVSLEDYK